MKHEEDRTHIAILAYLGWVLPSSATPAWHTPNGGARDARAGAKMKKLGARAGFPDLAFLHKGKFYALEVKAVAGRQRQNQLSWETHITNAGGFYEVVRSIDDAKAALQKWGIVEQKLTGK